MSTRTFAVAAALVGTAVLATGITYASTDGSTQAEPAAERAEQPAHRAAPPARQVAPAPAPLSSDSGTGDKGDKSSGNEGSDQGSGNEGSDQGGRDNGGSDQGSGNEGSDQGGRDSGGSDQGSGNEGSDQGGRDSGGSDQGSGNGGSDQGGRDNGGSDQGGRDNEGSDRGGYDDEGGGGGGRDRGYDRKGEERIYFNERTYSAHSEGCNTAASGLGSSSFSIYNNSRNVVEVYRGFACDGGSPVATVGPYSSTYGVAAQTVHNSKFFGDGVVGSFRVIGHYDEW